jgi:hypothetical protein
MLLFYIFWTSSWLSIVLNVGLVKETQYVVNASKIDLDPLSAVGIGSRVWYLLMHQWWTTNFLNFI